MVSKCNAITKAGKTCQGNPLPGRPYCYAHDPERAEERALANKAGGYNRADHRRVIKYWAAFGEEMGRRPKDIPAILLSCMGMVYDRKMTPGEATAIAHVARTAVQIAQSVELEERMAALERAAGLSVGPSNIRRIG